METVLYVVTFGDHIADTIAQMEPEALGLLNLPLLVAAMQIVL